MQSILVVEPSNVLRVELTKELQKHYQVYSCTDGSEGLSLISIHHPDGLILNLMPCGIDGIYFLECMQARPKAILTLSAVYPPHVLQRLMDLDVDYALTIGCPVRAIAHHMRYFLEHAAMAVPPSKQEIAATHLMKLNVPHWGGYDDLRIAIPLFSQDPKQSMVKELYPAVAVLRDRENWHQVEKSIRNVKEYAYAHRNDAVWKEYFPDTSCCPTNKAFIARLAEFIP